MLKVPQLLLAAGGSTRMGRPKALLPWGNTTLLQYRIEVLQQLEQPIILVLGADANTIQEQLIFGHQLSVIVNSEWEKGMGNSIVIGMSNLIERFPNADGVLISLLDQPLIPKSHYLSMLQKSTSNSEKILVSESERGWKGVPALFPKIYFDELSNLQGDESGKTVIRRHSKKLLSIYGENYLDDMDTPEAYNALLQKASSEF